MADFILQDSPETYFPGANGVLEHIGFIMVFTAQLDQLPHQLIGFIYGQLILGKNSLIIALMPIIENTGRNVLARKIGNADVQISLFHDCLLPFRSSWNNYIIA